MSSIAIRGFSEADLNVQREKGYGDFSITSTVVPHSSLILKDDKSKPVGWHLLFATDVEFPNDGPPSYKLALGPAPLPGHVLPASLLGYPTRDLNRLTTALRLVAMSQHGNTSSRSPDVIVKSWQSDVREVLGIHKRGNSDESTPASERENPDRLAAELCEAITFSNAEAETEDVLPKKHWYTSKRKAQLQDTSRKDSLPFWVYKCTTDRPAATGMIYNSLRLEDWETFMQPFQWHLWTEEQHEIAASMRLALTVVKRHEKHFAPKG